MFRRCTSLTTAPELPAITLATQCYSSMFRDCTELNYVKHYITEWNISNTNDWLSNVSANGTMYCPLNSTIPSDSTSGVPSGWTRVDIVDEPLYPEVTDNEDILVVENFDEVEGTVKLNNPNNIPIQYSTNGSEFNEYITETEVPIGVGKKVYFKWSDVISNSSNSTALVNSTVKYKVYGELKKGNNKYAYNYMFFFNSNLIDASGLNLTSTSTAESCYQRMFTSCTSLTTAPEIFATTLKYNSFYYMFFNCTSLNYVKHHITEWNIFNTTDWLHNVASSGTVECPANSTIPSNDDDGIPSGWTRVDF
jgi:hypothetical protein